MVDLIPDRNEDWSVISLSRDSLNIGNCLAVL